jgi:hypothetical protein
MQMQKPPILVDDHANPVQEQTAVEHVTTEPEQPTSESEQPVASQEPQPKSRRRVKQVVREIIFTGPAGELPGYMSRRIDLFQLTVQQQTSLYSLWAGLVRDGAKLKNGTVVKAPSHAVKWMLENCFIE